MFFLPWGKAVSIASKDTLDSAGAALVSQQRLTSD
jgi:hypothetical protein